MSFLQKLIVENFQSHEYTEVDLTPGLNVIVGPSDYGKSALVRALRWVFFNEPRGANFIRVGANTCRVTVELADGARITRLRSTGGKNQYFLQKPGESERVYEGFGAEVPQEIILASGMRKVVIDDRNRVELNFGLQLDGPFLLVENGAVRAKVIGQLGGVHIIDWAQKSVATDLRRLREEDGQLQARLAGLGEALQAYDHLPRLQTEISRLDEMVQKAEALERVIETLGTIAGQWQDVSRTLSLVEEVIAALALLGQVEEKMRLLDRLIQECKQLFLLAFELGQVEQQLDVTRMKIEALASLEQAEDSALKLKKHSDERLQLLILAGEISQAAKQLGLAEKIIAVSADVPLAEEFIEKSGAFCNEWKDLGCIACDLEGVGIALLKAAKIKETTGDLDIADSYINKSVDIPQRLKAYQELWRSWQDHERDYRGVCLAAQRYQAEMEKNLNEFQRILARLGKCPVCFGELNADAIKRVLAEYE